MQTPTPSDQLLALQRQAQAAREFSHVCSPATFTLRVPTAYDTTIVSLRSGMRGQADAAASVILQRALLLVAIVDWQGVQTSHVVPTEAPEPLAFEPGAIGLLLDAQQGWEGELWSALVDRIAQRQTLQDEASKN